MEFFEDLLGDLFEGKKNKKQRHDYDEEDNHDMDPKSSLTCKSCNKPNPTIANFCMHCGVKLVKNEQRFCPSCGAKQNESAKFCSSCGTKQF